MAPLLDWVKQALEPRYEVEAVLARGGMGAVFRGRNPRLQHPIAIKVLLPEIATAETAERFLREARVLARIQHPHVVPVHEVDEAAGLFYYVMDFIEGPTLGQLLERGPLAPRAALKLGRDLLDALQAVHALGFVHRDVKPSNVFMSRDRTVLADFGIVTSSTIETGRITRPNDCLGTRAYMAPEQLAGGKATPQSDLYAAGMVIYEAHTGREWVSGVDPRGADWSGVPRVLRRVLSKALQTDPRKRWPDANAFRHALWKTRVRPYRRRTAVLTAAGVTVGAVAFGLFRPGRPAPLPAEGLVVRVATPVFRGPASEAWLADSVARVLARLMHSATDFRVCAPHASCRDPTITLRSTVMVADSGLELRVAHEAAGQIGEVYTGDRRALAEWAQEVDRAADAGLRVIWNANSPLKDWLPLAALPASDAGYEAWFRAERLLNQAQWQVALRAFKSAFTLDSTCLLCSWRITEIQRWLVERPDLSHLLRAHHAIDRFPPHYRPVTTARWLPLAERLAVLEDATQQWSGFPYAWFLWGEEVFHRGPLAGLSPATAIDAFRRTTQLDPTFGPAWEHLAWANTAAGNAEAARDALDAYDALLAQAILQDDFAFVIRTLMELGYAWRFSPQTAMHAAAAILREPRVALFPNVGAGPRLLATFDSRQGMLDVADLLLDNAATNSNARYSADVARLLALVALGRVEQARHVARDLGFRYPERRDAPLFALKLDAALRLVDPSAVPLDPTTLAARLSAYGIGASSLHGLPGALWLRLMLDPTSEPLEAVRIDSLPPSLTAILRATAASPREALAATTPERLPLLAEVLHEQPTLHVERLPDPFYRTILRFQRAAWHAAVGDRIAAADELRFHEAWDLGNMPLGLPEPGEIDWAFGTLARWRRAELLRDTPQLGEACTDLQVVAVRWVGGDPVFRARADSAAATIERLRCAPPPTGLGW